MKKILLLPVLMILSVVVKAMCGYMAPIVVRTDQKLLAGSMLYNKSSKVIVVRDGDRTVVTMANDFKGDASDFAMVIPVPVVVSREQIKVVDNKLFTELDQATAPRIQETWDPDPCQNGMAFGRTMESVTITDASSVGDNLVPQKAPKTTVKIEDQFVVGEYEIVVLSATESGDMAKWLKENDYFVSDQAEEVIRPYIKQGMKFFVAKVKAEKSKDKFQTLSALQINFNTPRFTLPIRFGMANSDGEQDMVVYGIARSGRVEATNYRTVNMPAGYALPEFVGERFESFYETSFALAARREGNAVIFMEYSNGSGSDRVDPFVNGGGWGRMGMASPISMIPQVPQETLKKCGVDWLTDDPQYHVTRMRMRYDRENWAQDIRFQVTPNTNAYQAAYTITHKFDGKFTCGDQMEKSYLQGVAQRRQRELQHLAHLTGWDMEKYSDYQNPGKNFKAPKEETVIPVLPDGDQPNGPGSGWNLGKIGLSLLVALLIGRALYRSNWLRKLAWRPVS